MSFVKNKKKLVLDNYEITEYTVVTEYEDGNFAYSVWTTDKGIANNFLRRLKQGLFGPPRAKVKSFAIVERVTTVAERVIDYQAKGYAPAALYKSKS